MNEFRHFYSSAGNARGIAMPGPSIAASVNVSDWRAAPLRVEGETIFAIGDVHGCPGQLVALLERFSVWAQPDRTTRLVFLGDLICRGPISIGALALWSAAKLESQFRIVDRLSGNHEQLLMLSIGGGSVARAAYDKWMSIDGATFVDELRRTTGRPDASLTRDLVLEATGKTVMDRLDHLQSHVWIGNTIFVHGGIDPSVDVATSLGAPRTTFGGNHWAWIQQPFLSWRGGFGGLMVVHGHTPPANHRVMSGYPDPHVFQHDRLSLDGGSALTGIVAGAQIEDGRYRVFAAH
jgi:serine/threonine protein phosphatase 1